MKAIILGALLGSLAAQAAILPLDLGWDAHVFGAVFGFAIPVVGFALARQRRQRKAGD